MFKISDFALPESLIKSACNSKGVGFVDLEISFTEQEPTSNFENNKIIVGPQESLEGTYWQILSTYFYRFNEIHGCSLFKDAREASAVYYKVQKFLDKIFKETERYEDWKIGEPTVQRLYQNPLIWIIMTDFICPVYEVPINNVRVILSGSHWVDLAKHYDSDKELDLDCEGKEPNLIFLNEDCVYEPLEMAVLFCCTLEAHGLCPKETVLDIDSNLFLKKKLVGIANLYFMEEQLVEDFINFIYTFAGVYNKSEEMVSSDNLTKEAQSLPNSMDSNWWFFGLIEKMLEPARGADEEIHGVLEELRDEIQDKVEQVRSESGREGANYEKLLRAINSDESPAKYVVLEKELSKGRLW